MLTYGQGFDSPTGCHKKPPILGGFFMLFSWTYTLDLYYSRLGIWRSTARAFEFGSPEETLVCSLAVIIHQCRQPDRYLDRVLEKAKDAGSRTLVISNNPEMQLCKRADSCLAFKGSYSLQDSMLCNIILHILGAGFRRIEAASH